MNHLIKITAVFLILLLCSGCTPNNIDIENQTSNLVPTDVEQNATGHDTLPTEASSQIAIRNKEKECTLALRMDKDTTLAILKSMGFKLNTHDGVYYYGPEEYSFSFSMFKAENGEYYCGLSSIQSYADTNDGLKVGDDAERIIELYGELYIMQPFDNSRLEPGQDTGVGTYLYNNSNCTFWVYTSLNEDGREVVDSWGMRAFLHQPDLAGSILDLGKPGIDTGGRLGLLALGDDYNDILSRLHSAGVEYDESRFENAGSPAKTFSIGFAGINLDFDTPTDRLTGVTVDSEKVCIIDDIRVGEPVDSLLSVIEDYQIWPMVDGIDRVEATLHGVLLMVDYNSADKIILRWLIRAEEG